MSLLSRLFGTSSAARDVAPPPPAPAPDRPVWVIGDVHGCDRLLDRIAVARAQDPF